MNAAEGKVRTVKLVECPRDAMQGWPDFIPTEKKIEYLDALIGVGFDSLDFGSFVSPKAIPQMADTKQVITAINPGDSTHEAFGYRSKYPWRGRSSIVSCHPGYGIPLFHF